MNGNKIVVGFWMRLLSDLLDAAFLGAFGFILSIPLGGLFYRMGESGLWLGVVITFLYTGILQSEIGQGQSLAKRLLKIQVLRLDGTFLSLPQSFLRYVVIALIFYNYTVSAGLLLLFPSLNNNSVFGTIYAILVLFLIIGTIILVAFHPLKRGLHDMLVGSIVVRKDMYDSSKIAELADPSKEKNAFVICGVLLVLLVGGILFVFQKVAPMEPVFAELIAQKQKIEKNTRLSSVSPNLNWEVSKGADGSQKKIMGINIVAFLEKSKFDNEKLRLREVQKAVDIVVASYSKLSECDYIDVQVRTGYNIGIWSFGFTQGYLYSTDGKPYEEKDK